MATVILLPSFLQGTLCNERNALPIELNKLCRFVNEYNLCSNQKESQKWSLLVNWLIALLALLVSFFCIEMATINVIRHFTMIESHFNVRHTVKVKMNHNSFGIHNYVEEVSKLQWITRPGLIIHQKFTDSKITCVSTYGKWMVV